MFPGDGCSFEGDADADVDSKFISIPFGARSNPISVEYLGIANHIVIKIKLTCFVIIYGNSYLNLSWDMYSWWILSGKQILIW